jgi:hypothetical protein
MSNYEYDEFYQRMSQRDQFYQQAVVFLAANRLAEVQSGPADPSSQEIDYELYRPNWVKKVFLELIRYFLVYLSNHKARRGIVHTQERIDPSVVIIDVSPTIRFVKLPPDDEADIDVRPLKADFSQEIGD